MMRNITLWRGIRSGVHPPDQKDLARDKAIRRMEAPPRVVLPLRQHIGAMCEPRVGKNDQVYVGTLVGDAESFVSAPIHSSVSGRVAQIAPHPHPSGGEVLSVIVENDGEHRTDPSLASPGVWEEMEISAIRKAIRDSGMVGLGGAAFPTPPVTEFVMFFYYPSCIFSASEDIV
jgi:electron transport complex protein RnfC